MREDLLWAAELTLEMENQFIGGALTREKAIENAQLLNDTQNVLQRLASALNWERIRGDR